jgi:hypothetical protein
VDIPNFAAKSGLKEPLSDPYTFAVKEEVDAIVTFSKFPLMSIGFFVGSVASHVPLFSIVRLVETMQPVKVNVPPDQPQVGLAEVV